MASVYQIPSLGWGNSPYNDWGANPITRQTNNEFLLETCGVINLTVTKKCMFLLHQIPDMSVGGRVT